jgi:diacylglycerol kinase family enzyme
MPTLADSTPGQSTTLPDTSSVLFAAASSPANQVRYHVVLNAKSGTALALGLDAGKLKAHFEAHGHRVTVDDEAEVPLGVRIRRAVQSEAEIIVAGGGDGTVTALAEPVISNGKTLAVIPLGTANLLARDLGVPLDLEAAIAALGEMRMRQIDVGEVNGHIFLHSVSVGTIPSIAQARERIRGRSDTQAWLAFARYLLTRLSTARRIAVAITSRDTTDRIERIHAIAVANNAYDEGIGKVFRRQCLDAGELTLYILKHLGPRDFVRLALEMVAGRWTGDDVLSVETVRSVSVRTKRPVIQALIDGEVQMLSSPLTFGIRPRALSILAPPIAGETSSSQGQA